MLTDKTPFTETIYRLRNNEEIVVFEKQLKVSSNEEQQVIDLLEGEYDNEVIDYPFTAPAFDSAPALWAAKLIYFTSQLILFREETAKDIPSLFPEYKGPHSAAAQLSADICLRFLPAVLHKIRAIDPDDILIQTLEKHLMKFPYSGVGYFTEINEMNYDACLTNDCCRQLFLNRVITFKDRRVAAAPGIKTLIESALGEHQQVFWPGLNM